MMVDKQGDMLRIKKRMQVINKIATRAYIRKDVGFFCLSIDVNTTFNPVLIEIGFIEKCH